MSIAKLVPVPEVAVAEHDFAIPGHLHPLSFIARLEWRLEHDPPKQKGQRTRERLKLAGARLLEANGIHELKAGDVSAEAGLAEGSFYLYFSDKTDLIRSVLDEFLSMFYSLQVRGGTARGSSAFESIRFANMIWIAFVRANAGLIRSAHQFADNDPAFADVFHTKNLRWHERIMRGVMRRGGPAAAMSEPEMLLVVYFLGGMMDDIVRRLFVNPDQQLVGVLAAAKASDETIADVATLLWLRVLSPGEVPPANLSPEVASVAKALFPGR